MVFIRLVKWRGLARIIVNVKTAFLMCKNFLICCGRRSTWSPMLGLANPRRQFTSIYGLSTSVLWRCAVIGIIPLLVWSLSEPMPITKWERAGDRHYKVWYAPGQDKACLILKLEHISPGLEPFTCRN